MSITIQLPATTVLTLYLSIIASRVHTRDVPCTRVHALYTRYFSSSRHSARDNCPRSFPSQRRSHWVALTVNVNITDLDRGEWIVKSITRAVTTESQLRAATVTAVAASVSSFRSRILFDLPSNKFPSTTHTAARKKGLRSNGMIQRLYRA